MNNDEPIVLNDNFPEGVNLIEQRDTTKEPEESIDIEASDEDNENDFQTNELDYESSGEDESYHGDSDFESEDESAISTASYKDVPNAFQNYVAGPNAIEIEEKNAEALFEKSQECLRAWDLNPLDITLKEAYFNTVHDLILNSSFSRMQRNPYTMDYTIARRMEDRLSSNPIMKAFYATHFQLTKLVHNTIPHYLQMLAYTPSRIELWYELGAKAIELGDWKNAEFAYRKYMAFSGDKIKALQNIVLSHFVSGDFPKAINTLKDLMAHQPNNIVSHVICCELSNIKGVWAENIDQVMIQSGVIKPRFALAQEKIDWVMGKIQQFRNRLKPECLPCLQERIMSSHKVHHLILKERDVMFYHFGNHLLQFYNEFVEDPDSLIFVMFPIREEIIEKDEKRQVEPESITEKSTSKPMQEVTSGESRHVESDSITIIERSTSKSSNSEAMQEVISIENNQADSESIIIEPSTSEPMEVEEPQILVENIKKLVNVEKTPLAINISFNGNYLQILDLLKQIAGSNQLECPSKELCGGFRVASIFDQLLTFVVKNFTAEEFKKHKLDCSIFMKLYQRWHELVEYNLNFKSDYMESIHLFAAKIGASDDFHRLDTIVYNILSSTQGKLNEELQPTHQSSLQMEIDVELERSSSPSYNRMVQMYEKMRKVQFEKTDIIMETTSSAIISNNFQNLRIFSLYLPKYGIDINFDIRPPKYVENMRFDSNLDVFSTSEMENLSEKENYFLISYHLMKSHHYRLKRESIQTDNIMEYRHLITLLKSVNQLLLDGFASFDLISDWQQFVNNDEIKTILVKIPLTFEELEDCTRRVIKLCKGFKIAQLECLITQFDQGEESEELAELLKNHEQLDVNADHRLDNLFVLYKCYKCHKIQPNIEEMFNTLLMILDKLLSAYNLKADQFLKKLNECLDEIDENLMNFTSFNLDKLITLLEQFTERYQCKTVSKLWILYYRVARLLDPNTSEELCELYETMDQKECLPTKSLLILKKAHKVLAEEKSCMKDGGIFLNLYLDELILAFGSEMINEAVSENGSNFMWKNITKELLSVFNCLYNLQLTAKTCKTHLHLEPTPKFPELNWNICERVLPLLLPADLPLYSEKCFLTVELVEILNKVNDFIEAPLNDELKREFGQFIENNKNYRPKINLEIDKFEMEEMHNEVNLKIWPYPSKISHCRRQLSAQVMYLLAFKKFKDSSPGLKSEYLAVRDSAIKVLMLGSDALNPNLISSLWTFISIRTDYIFEEKDVELFKEINTLLFPSYMAILFRKKSAENHMELATNFYKIFTRFSRYLSNKNNHELRNEIQAEFNGLLTKSKTHFKIAKLYGIENNEILWSSTYYLGKIGEKTNLPLEDIMEIYQNCAFLMEENFQFLKKVPKNDHNDFEQLELYYCIHSFLNKRRQQFLTNSDLIGMRKVIRCLEIFSEKNISRDKNGKTPNFSIDLRAELGQVEQAFNNENVSMDLKRCNSYAEELLCHAFEEILSLFPHYKAAFRLAKHKFDYEQFEDAADLLFKEIFPIKGELNEKSNIFQGFTEINCSSFYYIGVLDYHLNKIILLLAQCLDKTSDIKRLGILLISLLKLQQRVGKIKLDVENGLLLSILNTFAITMIRVNTVTYPTFSTATDPLYNIRPILFEIAKQLKRTNNQFANDFQSAINDLQKRWTSLTTLPNY